MIVADTLLLNYLVLISEADVREVCTVVKNVIGSMSMSNLQLYIAIGLPTLAVLASLTVTLIQVSAIREDIAKFATTSGFSRARCRCGCLS